MKLPPFWSSLASPEVTRQQAVYGNRDQQPLNSELHTYNR